MPERKGAKCERRRPIDARRKLLHSKGEAPLRNARQLERHLARRNGASLRRAGIDVAADRNPLVGGRERRIDDEHESGVAVEAAAAQSARLCRHLQCDRPAGFEIGQPPGQHLHDPGEGRAVRDQALLRHPIAEGVVLDRKRLGIMVGDPADGRVHRKGDCDHVVERSHEVDVAVGAAAVAVEILERPEAVDHAGADRAKQDPVHLEEAERSGVQEKIDRLRLREALVGGEFQGIHAQKLGVARRTDVALELGHEPRTPRPRRFQRRQALFEKLLVNRCHGESSPRTARFRANEPSWSSAGAIPPLQPLCLP